MRHLCILLLCAVVAADGLDPVAFLAGEFEGTGRHPWGEYTETLKGEWALGRSVLIVRSKSTMQGRTVFEDVRVFSHDGKGVRMRQYAMGDLAIYDVVVREDGRIVFKETAHEGKARPEWRYTLTRGEEGFEYLVEARGKQGLGKYVAGALRRKTPDPAEQGSRKPLVQRARAGGLAVEVHHPDGPGPYPVVVFSPGGAANSTRGYAPFGRWFASWGYVTCIVAFDERDPGKRAHLFGDVADWLADDPPLEEKLDVSRLVAAGHSLGGYAAVLAARRDNRFKACLALAPSGPKEAPEGETCPVLVVVGDRDEFHETCASLFASLPAPRTLVEIEGMNHGFAPPDAGMKVLARATAFLQLHVARDARYRSFLVKKTPGITITDE